MPLIYIETEIKAPQDLVFDLSRSLTVPIIYSVCRGGKVVGCKPTGLLGLNEEVTLKTGFLGLYQYNVFAVTGFHRPSYFSDEMIEGVFKIFKHENHFSRSGDFTVMTDVLQFESSCGFLSGMVNLLFMKPYLTSFLKERSSVIKRHAELRSV